MASTVADLVVNINGKDVGLARILGQLEGRMTQTDAQGRQLTDLFGRALPAGQTKSADSALRLAQSLARSAQAMGDNATATRILTTGLQQAAGASDQAVASVTAQIARLQSGKTFASEFGASLKSGLMGIVGPAAAATAAIGAVSSVVASFSDALALKAQLDATTAAINVQLRGVRDTGEVWQQASAFARQYGLTQQEVNSGVAASVGIMRTSKAGLEDILGVLARMQILSPEQSISDAALALKALASGDTQSLVARFEVSRDLAAKMKTEIQGGADAVGVMSNFLNQMGVGMDAVAAKTQGVNGAFLELKQAQEDLKLAQAAWAEGPGLVVLQGQTTVLSGLTRVLTGDTEAMGQSLTNNLNAYAAWIGLTDGAISSGGTWGNVLQQNTAQLMQVGAAMDEDRVAIGAGQVALQEHAVALEEDALKSQLAAVQAEELATKKNLLAQQAQVAANALLGSGASGEAAAARLANSSSLVDQLTAAYYRLAAAQGASVVAAAKGQQIVTKTAGDDLKNEQLLARSQQQKAKAAKDYAAMQAAERDRILQIGSATEKVALAQQDLANARAKFGANSAEAFRAETALLRLQESSAKAGRAAHKAGGAGRLSDQQQLHNSLLASDQKYGDQAEQAAIAHEQRLLDIEQEFAQKSLEQQRQNEVSKRQSRADFYDNLTSATGEVGQQVAQELSAAYEAAYAQAQAIAQAGNAKLAADYLALKERQLSDETEFQKKLAAARKAGDDAEVQRLQAVHKLRQDAAAQEEKQLLEGGDANVNARDKALSDEQAKFDEQQGKIADSADRAAQRKIDAADRSGKAIDAENEKLRQQQALLDRIGAGGPGGTATPGTPPSTGAPAAPVAGAQAATAGADLNTVVEAINSLQALLSSIQGAITTDTRETTGAIDRLGSRAVGA